jgi:3-oxoacyl-[acyl-carrier-protein] synthase-3
MGRFAAITGWGHYLPSKVLTNRDLESLVDTKDERIRELTGISNRRIAGPAETTSSMCALAGLRALEQARMSPEEVDLVICATTTPDHLLPATSCLVQGKIRASRAAAFDVNAACTGFIHGLVVGSQFIQAGTCDRVLVVAGETLSRFVNWEDRETCVLFGDGAGAVVLESTSARCGVLSSVLGCQGDVNHLLAIEAGGCAKPATTKTLRDGEHYITMRGKEVFKLAVRSMHQAAAGALAKAGLSVAEIRMVIPHQANLRIIRGAQERLTVSAGMVFVNVDRCGNTGAASIPIALSEFLAAEAVEQGDNLLLLGFGGGITWAAAVIQWADVSATIADRGGRHGSFSVAGAGEILV